MITIRMNRREIQVEGHASFAEKGKDIVCAGVSALVLTGAEFLGYTRILDVSTLTRIIDPAHPRHLAEKLHFNFVRTGLILIAESYPKYIRIEELT